ncbi:MAG: hypothetical protein JW940_21890 [Polyangiaceae bacterium]|nr:hypothetical protein [Polyangiaceae bacterium]
MARLPYRLLVVGIAGVSAPLVLWSCTRTDWGTDDIRPVSCDDGRKNGSESDIDCGGLECQECATGKACLAGSDCASGQCTRGACEALHCSNLVQDRDEEGVDCGGQDCPACGGSDPCANQRQDENETDVDCGGPSGCVRCGAGDSCAADGDCLSHRCIGSVCQDIGTGTGGGSNTGGSGGHSGGETGGTGVGGASTGGSSGGSSGGSGAFAGAPSDGGMGTGAGGGTAETGGSEDTGGQPSTGGAAAGEGGAGAPSTGGSEPCAGEGGAGGAAGGSLGGMGGMGGITGTGGTGACSDNPISGNGLITDFSEFTPGMTWTSGERTWGNEDLSGTTQHYGSSGVMLTAAITSEGNLRLTSSIPNLRYVGFALDFRTCSDASAFAGISVTIQGDTAGSSLFLQLETSRNMPNDLPGGQCEFASEATRWDDCSYNRIAITDITAASQVVELSWSQFTGGVPITPVDEAELLGMQFQFQCVAGADCAMDVTITEVRLIAP